MEQFIKRMFDKKFCDLQTVEVDGGVVERFDKTAPKTISCTKPIHFKCTVSTLALADAEEDERGVFTLTAKLEKGVVSASYKSNSESFDFAAPPSFMDRLQSVIAEYDFARFNGMSYVVSGLPDMYGATVSVKYESGEDIYSNNNQDCFIPLEAIKKLIAIFKKHK